MKQKTIALLNMAGGIIIIAWALFGFVLSFPNGIGFNDDVVFLIIGLLIFFMGLFFKQKGR